MLKINKTLLTVIVVGCISIMSSLFFVLMGSTFKRTLWGIILGITLIGTAIINSKKEVN